MGRRSNPIPGQLFRKENFRKAFAPLVFSPLNVDRLIMMDFPEAFERTMLDACAASNGAANLCTIAIREHLAAGGGRIRARVCLTAGGALGVAREDAIRIATVCELLHNASLIQDDLLDRSAVRRGEPCVWVRHGDTVAVCAGDLMLSAAYGILGDLSVPDVIGQAIRLVHQRTKQVISGQAAEAGMQPGHLQTVLEYEQMAMGKSASLISLPLELPLLLAGQSQFMPRAESVASDFAIAYQIADDLEDFEQDSHDQSSNFLRRMMERDRLCHSDACAYAIQVARERLASSVEHARTLPNDCASALIEHANKLQNTFERHRPRTAAAAGV